MENIKFNSCMILARRFHGKLRLSSTPFHLQVASMGAHSFWLERVTFF